MLSITAPLDPTQYGPEAQTIHEKTIVVVGDAGALGGVTALRLAKHGARVFLASRSHEELEAVRTVARRFGGQVEGMVVDFCATGEMERLMAAAAGRGAFHALVNFLPVEKALCFPRREKEMCALSCMQQAMVHLAGRKDTQIISVAQKQSSPADQALAAALRRQARQQGIRVTLIEADGTDFHGEADAVADCVVSSLLQPFGVDLVFLQGSSDGRAMVA